MRQVAGLPSFSSKILATGAKEYFSTTWSSLWCLSRTTWFDRRYSKRKWLDDWFNSTCVACKDLQHHTTISYPPIRLHKVRSPYKIRPWFVARKKSSHTWPGAKSTRLKKTNLTTKNYNKKHGKINCLFCHTHISQGTEPSGRPRWDANTTDLAPFSNTWETKIEVCSVCLAFANPKCHNHSTTMPSWWWAGHRQCAEC